jgi:demethylmenaquinone methyltransferase/2-methoxy-6-polyprenyl-1,4-benzoquinol methylase
MDYHVQMAHLFNRLRKPVFRSAIQALQIPSGSRGLDAGCGLGLQALMLAEVVGPAGHVTGLDLSPEFLAYARDQAKKAGLADRTTFREGDANKLPFDDDTFDWAWSVDCVGYAPMEPLPLVKELARVVKPGGTLAILAWSSETLLPGYPLLEAYLSATSAGIAPFRKGKKPESHFLRALGWFREAGMEECAARTFAGDVHAPLTEDQRSALAALFEMRWPGVESELRQAEADGEHPWTEFQRLCLPESLDFVLDHPDYYAFYTYSMFHGKVASQLTWGRE